MSRIVTVCLSLLAGAALAGELSDVLAAFDVKRHQLAATRDHKLSFLKERYLSALKRHLEAIQRTGKLERVLPIKNEIDAVTAGKPGELSVGARRDSKLTDLRRTYDTNRQQILDDYQAAALKLAVKTEELIDQRIDSLTRAGRLEQAVSAKELRGTLRPMLGIGVEDGDDQNPGAGATEAPSKDAGGWMRLLDLPFKIEPGAHYTGLATGEGGKGTPNPPVIRRLNTLHRDPRQVIQIGSGASVEFKLPENVSELRGTVMVVKEGDMTFRVRVRGKVVLEERVAGIGNMVTKKLSCSFGSSSHVTLEVKNSGRIDKAVAAWVEPKVR